MTLTSRTLLSASLLVASAIAEAQVQFPTDADLQGFRKTCAGGEVKKNSASLEGALLAWRTSPAARANVQTASAEVGAVLEYIRGDVAPKAYETYTACVQNLILGYLKLMNPTPAPTAKETTPARKPS